MPPLALLTAFLLLLLLLLFLFSSSAAAATFPNCQRTFSCGSLHNLTYPFTGGDRPDYCGPPEFRLTCRDDTHAELTLDSVPYRVLEINKTQQTLVLARSDLWNNTCPKKFDNSTTDSNVFNYDFDNQDLHLVYGCSSLLNYTPYNRFNCTVSGVNSSDAFYVVGPVPVDPILGNVTKCNVMITVPVASDAASRLIGNQTTLAETLMKGFHVIYKDPYVDECSNCTWIGGRCGFDANSSSPICICGDLQCPIPNIIGSRASSQSRKAAANIAMFIAGAVLTGVGLGWGIFTCRQRRERRKRLALAAQSSRSTETKSKKDIYSPPLSRGLTAGPSTNFSDSIPSFPSSKFSEFGKASTYFGVQVFSYAELEEATGNFDCSRELGDGGFGTVYYGKLQDGREVAVKRLYENNFKRLEQFLNEVEILTHLRHDNLVILHGCTSKRSRELVLVYEYIPNGTVADHLHGSRSSAGLLSWPIRLSIALETANALAYLHASDIIHRDVKTTNILLDNDFHVKVADFGLSRLFPTDVTHVSTAPQGTPGYVDPEYYQCYQITEKSDVYSFGVVLIELISSKQAVDTNRDRHDINLSNMAVNKIQNHALHELVDPSLGFETNSSVRRMITFVAELAFRCLQTERDMRPSMEEVLTALRGIKNEEFNAQKAEVVDIGIGDEAGLLTSDSTTPNSIG
ncbi:Leaf rust 10 disease-resistance locus receptor-like protein kinase [Actinidia chinensis var. chinensis]|uniref:non-specific serine/threonine protein kinase n=1 Tax=Actinidia chinensis var. chinensis TaxID=1590841 RepID=A0A2R6RKN8_ACTCC|nr:Leaf rust 10 disease-resistance locus receptor-like protein kinase [Actinidia chinensis var. chinensis]